MTARATALDPFAAAHGLSQRGLQARAHHFVLSPLQSHHPLETDSTSRSHTLVTKSHGEVMKRKLICISAFLALVAGSAWGQEKHQFTMSGEGVKGRYVQQYIVDMDDVAGHKSPTYEAHPGLSDREWTGD